jgi:hypothetical protein
MHLDALRRGAWFCARRRLAGKQARPIIRTTTMRKTAKAVTEPRFVTQIYYGKITITHFDQETIAKISTIMRNALNREGLKATCRTEWVLHSDGTESTDAVWNGSKFVAPAKVEPQHG